MTFLKKLGSLLVQGALNVAGLGKIWGFVSPLFGSAAVTKIGTTVVNDLQSIGQVVVQAEALIQTPGSGAAKLAAATPLVSGLIKTSQLLDGHKIANEALFTEGATDITSGMAKILNSLSPDSIKTA